MLKQQLLQIIPHVYASLVDEGLESEGGSTIGDTTTKDSAPSLGLSVACGVIVLALAGVLLYRYHASKASPPRPSQGQQDEQPGIALG